MILKTNKWYNTTVASIYIKIILIVESALLPRRKMYIFFYGYGSNQSSEVNNVIYFK